MAKHKKTVSKHDMIRAIKDMNSRIMYLDSMVASIGGMFRSYVEFMGNEDEYIKHMEEQEEQEENAEPE